MRKFGATNIYKTSGGALAVLGDMPNIGSIVRPLLREQQKRPQTPGDVTISEIRFSNSAPNSAGCCIVRQQTSVTDMEKLDPVKKWLKIVELPLKSVLTAQGVVK
jgi:hypothetical protein